MLSHSNSMRRARPLLGTIVEIGATGNAQQASAAIEAAFSAIEQVHRLMSFHDASSDVGRINAAEEGHEIVIDPRTAEVLKRAIALSDLSGGAFDVVTAGTLVRQGFLPLPTGRPPMRDANYQDIILMGDRMRWRRKGWLDLGGIAKGYAVDCAIVALQAQGINAGVVNAGGDLRCFGQAQAIHVRRPSSPTELIPLGWLSELAIATSSGYFAGTQTHNGQIDPLVDPRQRACVRWQQSVSAIAVDCMTADALTKIVRLAPEHTPAILDSLGAQAVVIDNRRIGTLGAPLLLQENMA